MQNNLIVISLLSFCFWTVGCSQGAFSTNWDSNSLSLNAPTGSQGVVATDPYQTTALNILQTNCSSCHTSTSGPNNIYGFNDVSHMISAGLIVVGNPSLSPIYTAIAGGVMPPSGALSASDQQIISEWISAMVSSSTSPTPTPTPTPIPTLTPTPTPVLTPTPGLTPTPTPVLTPTPTPSSSDPNATFTYIEKNILGVSCTGCHSFNTYSSVMNVVSPGNPSGSLLYTEVSSGNMPKGGPPLSSAQVQIIYDWIKAGALNN